MVKRRQWLWLWPFVAATMIGGCASPSLPSGELLSQSYHAIDNFYLQPTPPRKMGMASLHALTNLDRNIVVEPIGDDVVLKRETRPISRIRAPAPDDWSGWGETAAQVAAAAQAVSPTISKLPADMLDEALIGGAMAALDPFSRYLTPEATRHSLIIEGDTDTGADIGADRSDAGSGLARPPDPWRPAVAAAVYFRTPSVLAQIDSGIAIIRISRFTTSTARLLEDWLARAEVAATPAFQAIILDLRSNPGGQVAAATQVADLFLDHGLIVVLEARNPSETQVFRAKPDGSLYETIPLVVLIDGLSASSAEFVAAALQGNGRAMVIGSASFGKGTAQKVVHLSNGGELWLSSAYTRTPAGYLLQSHGVIPDICTRFAKDNALFGGPSLDTARHKRFQDLLSRPRASLDEMEWAELRSLCPPRTDHLPGDPDLQLAKQLLSIQTQSLH
jgi:carboxyl-terminal processing protease